MENIKKKSISLGVIVLLVAVVFLCHFLFFKTDFAQIHQEIELKYAKLMVFQNLLAKHDSIEAKWHEQKKFFAQGNGEGVLNLWIKDLIATAQDQGIVFEKLEPKRLKQRKGKQEIGVFLKFSGDIRKLVGFLHRLYREDLLVKVQGFVIEQQAEPKSLVYELTLIKVF